jgi:hypothetical protein
MEKPVVKLLAQLQKHPILRYLTLDRITTLVRLITNLKREILQPQPINDSNPAIAPAILPQIMTMTLAAASMPC